MIVGYARTSGPDQQAGLEAQCRDLQAAGVEKVFREHVSGATAQRSELLAALEFVRSGDTLMATKPDRLARSTADLLAIIQRLESKGVSLVICSMGGTALDTGSPTGKLMLTMLAAISCFERELMLERQRDGIAAAKEAGKYKGRVPTAMRQADEVRRLRAEGVSAIQIAQRLKISRASVYRVPA